MQKLETKLCPVCGKNKITTKWIEPVYNCFTKRNISGTGSYEYPLSCDACVKKQADDEKILEKQQIEDARLLRISNAEFSPRHKTEIKKQVEFPENLRNIDTKENLFIYGGTGTGKTCFAVKRLYAQINAGKCGVVKSYPELLMEFRRMSRTGSDIDLLDYITGCDCLVIDDFGVGRKEKEYVLEMVYMILERWYTKEKTGLTITCNKDLDFIAKMDDRFSSRIAEMCKIIKLTGQDFRLK